MSIEIIPYQPIKFIPSTQEADDCKCGGATPCLLVEHDDFIYAQVKMNPCGAELICSDFTALGSDQITNGLFPANINDWTGANWAWDAGAGNGYALHTAGAITPLAQTLLIGTLIDGRTYRVTFTIRNRTAGSVDLYLGGTIIPVFTTSGNYTVEIQAGAANEEIRFIPTTDFDGGIDTVTLRLIAPCWALSGVVALATVVISAATNNACVNGTLTFTSTVAANFTDRYAVSFIISNYVSGTVNVNFGNNVPIFGFSGNGQKFAYEWFNVSTDLIFVFTNFIGCISNVSTKKLVEPEFYFVNQDTGVQTNLNTAGYVTFEQDRAIVYFQPLQFAPYGCYKICLVDKCGIFFNNNLILNGTFDTNLANWTVNSGWVWAAPSSAATVVLSNMTQIFSGAQIKVCARIKVISFFGIGNLQLGIGTGNIITSTVTITAAGVYSLVGTGNKIFVYTTAGVQVVIDDIEVIQTATDYDCSAFDYCSPCIKFAVEMPCTKLIEGYCEDDAFRFVFNDVNGNNIFKLQMRVKSEFLHPKYPQEQADYIFSSGKTQITSGQAEKFQALTFSPIPEYKHDVIALQKLCDTLVIDGASYFAKKSDYNPEWSTGTNADIAPSKIDVKKKDDTLFNSLCE